jgi:hypothetical protein
MNNREVKREKQRTQSNREELVERIARALPEDGALEAFPGFFLARSSKPMECEFRTPARTSAPLPRQSNLGEELFGAIRDIT